MKIADSIRNVFYHKDRFLSPLLKSINRKPNAGPFLSIKIASLNPFYCLQKLPAWPTNSLNNNSFLSFYVLEFGLRHKSIQKLAHEAKVVLHFHIK